MAGKPERQLQEIKNEKKLKIRTHDSTAFSSIIQYVQNMVCAYSNRQTDIRVDSTNSSSVDYWGFDNDSEKETSGMSCFSVDDRNSVDTTDTIFFR